MPNLIMERGRQKLQNVLEDGFSRDLMNAGRFCFSCEQIFANRKCLEEHVCSAASYICSCGTEFTEYKNMLEHSSKHEPGHQVLDHETIRKRRNEKRIAEEEQLKRLQTGEVVWKSPKLDNTPTISLPVKQVPFTSARMPPVPMQSAQISQVPQLNPSVSQPLMPPNPISSTSDIKNIFANVGAPTADLWTIYQPVVLLQTVRTFNNIEPYSCGKCGQSFMTRTSLISHHSSHVTDKVSGCIGCGLLLSSKKIVPRFHICNSRTTATKFKLITARPQGNEMLIDKSRNPSAWGPWATSSRQLKSQNPSAASKGRRAPHVNSNMWLTHKHMRTYGTNNQGLHVTSPLQLKSQNPSASKPYVTVSLPSKSRSPNPSAYNKSSQVLPVTPSGHVKMPTNSASGVPSKPMQTSTLAHGFTCRVCYIPFETAQLLQRHKCAKAQEFMAQHLHGGKQPYKLKRVTPVASPNPAQMNGDRRLGVPASINMKKRPIMAVGLDKGQAAAPVNGKIGMDVDEDCYIVEKGPDKPAEMIYQVTSSVPIKT